MKRFITCGLLFMSTVCFGADELYIKINDLRGGINDRLDDTLIADNEVSDAVNAVFDKETTVETRAGMVKINSVALGSSDNRYIYSQYEYKVSSGSYYHIVHSSKTLYYKETGSEWIPFHIGISSTASLSYAVFMDTLNYCNGEIGVVGYAMGSSTFTQTAAYNPKFIISWQNRLCIAGDTSDEVRFCGFQNPQDWVSGVDLSTSPCTFSINSQDGQNVTGFFLSPNGNLGILKEKSVWEIGGYDKSDFYQRQIISSLGCRNFRSVEYKDGKVYWMSDKGKVVYDGSKYEIISENIRKTINSISQVRDNSGFFMKDTQEQWTVLTISSNITTSASHGYIQPDKFTISNIWDNINNYTRLPQISQAGNGIFHTITGAYNSNISYMSFNTDLVMISSCNIKDSSSFANLRQQNNRLAIDTSNIVHTVYQYYDSASNSYKLIYSSGSGTSFNSSTVDSFAVGSGFGYTIDLDISDNPHIFYVDTDDSYRLYYTSYTNNILNTPIGISNAHYYEGMSCSVDNSIINLAAYYQDSGSGFINVIFASATIGTSDFSVSTFTNVDQVVEGLLFDSSNNPYIITTDFSSSNNIYISSYTATTGWSTFTITTTIEPEQLSYDIDADDNIGILFFENSSKQLRYAKILVDSNSYSITNVATESSAFGHDFILDLNAYPIAITMNAEGMNVYRGTSTYISEIKDTHYDSLFFDMFQTEEIKNAHDIIHYIRTGESENACQSATWNIVARNTIPDLTAMRYMQYKVDIASNILTDNYSKVGLANINYRTANNTIGISSMYYNEYIWDAVSISSVNVLDTILVYDSNGKWTKYKSQINAASLLNFKGVPYVGSNDGYIYQCDIGTSDAGLPIETYVITKNYNFGSAFYTKNIENIYVLALKTGNWDISLDYYLDKTPTANESFSINLGESELINYKLPLKKRDRFHTMQVKIYNNNEDENFKILGLYCIGRGYPLK